MQKYLKFLVLTPLLFAAICDPIDDGCGIDNPEIYTFNVETVSENYEANETIWISAQTSAMVINFCTETNEPELITDNQFFLDGFFILKLENLSSTNAEVFNDAEIVFSVGESFTFNSCSNAINSLPVLSDNDLFYQYRLGISIGTPGDYCIVSSRNNNFSINHDNNSVIFNEYNTLNNEIKFDECNRIYTRIGTEGHYFFRIL